MKKEKEIYNQVCGALECDVTATKRVVLSAGFSAHFCDRCATELVNTGMGKIEQHLDNYPSQDCGIVN